VKPVLFEYGPIALYSYGATLALAFLISVALLARQAKSAGINPGKIVDLALVIMVTGIIGSRLLYVGLNWAEFVSEPYTILFLFRGGLAIYGGLILSIPVGLWFAKRNSLPPAKTADLIAPYGALAQAIGRLGCFLNGCCYGKTTMSVFGIVFPGHIDKVHPSQIYSAVGLFVIFLILRALYKRQSFNGQIILSYLILYSIFRFLIEFVRVNPVFILGLSFHQYASVMVFLLSFYLYVRRRRICTKRPLQ